MGGLTMHRHFEPDHAVVAAADLVELPALHNDGVVGFDGGVFHQPTGPEERVGFFIRGERHLDVHLWDGLGRRQGLDGEQETGDGALHVGRAAAIDPITLDFAAEGAAVFPLARDRHDIVVGVEVDGFLRALGGEFAEHVVTGKSMLVGREHFLHFGHRHRQSFGLQADGIHFIDEVGGDRGVVFPGRIDGGGADEFLQTANQIGGMGIDVGGGCNRHG